MNWTSIQLKKSLLNKVDSGPIYMGSGTRDNPPLAEVTFSLFLCKIQPAVYIRIANPSRGRHDSGVRGRKVCRKGNPGKRDNFSWNKRFGLPNRVNSSRGECPENVLI